MNQHRRRFLAIVFLDRKGGDIAVIKAGQLLNRPLNILRPMVLAIDDNHVLGTANDEQIAIGHIAHIACIKPAIDEAFARCALIAEIGMHDAGAAAPDLADLMIASQCLFSAFLQSAFVGTTDFDVHIWQSLAAVYDSAITRRPRQITRRARQSLFLDQFNPDTFARRHNGHGQNCLGQAIAWGKGACLKTGIGKGVDEILHNVGPDHVRAIARHAPARQVETFCHIALAGNAPRTNIIAECWRIRARIARIAANHVEPSKRAARKSVRLQIIDRELIGDQ